MFLIAGIAPKLKIIDDKPVLCPVCGLAQAHYKRIDLYLNLFFIPILRIKTGEPFVMCDRCEKNMHELGPEYLSWLESSEKKCPLCNKSIHMGFKYCPFCGNAING